jgi:hypothetical protein
MNLRLSRARPAEALAEGEAEIRAWPRISGEGTLDVSGDEKADSAAEITTSGPHFA